MRPDIEHDRTGGFIAVHRKLLDNPLTTQLPAAWFRVFIVILLRANWKPGTWWDGKKNVTIAAGVMVTSVEKLSQISGATRRQTRNALSHLQATKTVTIQTTSRYTVITLTNWERYQSAFSSNGKLGDKSESHRTTKSRQSNGKPAATIKEVNQGIIQEGENPLDSCSASRKKRAKADQPVEDEPPSLEGQNRKPLPNEEGREILRTVMARQLGEVVGPMGELLAPDHETLDAVIAACAPFSALQFAEHLRSMPAAYQAGGRAAPRKWGWFIRTAQNWASQQVPKTPTADRCCHGKPYGVCCLAQADVDEMSCALEVNDRVQ